MDWFDVVDCLSEISQSRFSVIEIFLYIFFFVFGLLFGSFANVVIYRLPQGKSVVRPRSSCQQCGAMIKWYDNIPVLSWIFLKGKCRSCQTKISWRYPFVELLTGLLFMMSYHYAGLNYTLVEYLVFSFSLVVCSFIDFDHMILPDEFTLSGIVIGLLGAWLNPDRNFLDAFIGVLIGGGFLWAMAYVYYLLTKNEGMGGGDIKLLAWIGAVLGWKAVPFVVMSSAIIGSVVGLIMARKGKDGLKTAIPFGPYLALGAVLFMFGAQNIGLWYFDLFFPAF